jgi:hypothetical protein
MKRYAFWSVMVFVLAAAALVVWSAPKTVFVVAGQVATARMPLPEYDASGALLRPRDFEHWMFVGANIGMSYSQEDSKGPGEFHSIYMQREAYAEYVKTGKFPEKTMFVLAVYDPQQKVSINKSGYFEGDLAGMAASVKDHERFPEGWAYYAFDSAAPGAKAAASPKPMCFDCHDRHADDDHVFVQFHTVLRHSHAEGPQR